jgi:hypothetical protein
MASLPNQSLALELIALELEDRRIRDELARDGSLFHGYHPRMQAVHDHNAARLTEVLDRHGWPGRSLVGEEAAHAAWLILQHAIGHPVLQRRGLALLKAAPATEVDPVEVAMLEDRIRSFEGRGQLYGTQFDWDRNGELNPLPIEDPTHVDRRRAGVGLGPLAADLARHRAATAASGERPPANWAQRRDEFEAWLRAVGWRA